MIATKPKRAEDLFIRRAAKASSSNGSNLKRLPVRLPEKLCERIKEHAYKKRLSVNALVAQLLEKAVPK